MQSEDWASEQTPEALLRILALLGPYKQVCLQ